MTMTDPDPTAAPPAWALAAEPEPFVHSPEYDKLYAALVKALAALHNVSTDQKADAGKYDYTYASLGAVMADARPTLGEHALAVMQSPMTHVPGEVTVATRIIHESGQWVEGRVTLVLAAGARANPQEVGSGVSYARRYGVSALLGIATESDDDGRAASAGRADSDDREAPPEPDPFEDPNRSPDLVTKADYVEILDLAHHLDDKARRELTEWREAEGIKITPRDLTAEQAATILDRLRPESATVEDATSAPEDAASPAPDVAGDDDSADPDAADSDDESDSAEDGAEVGTDLPPRSDVDDAELPDSYDE